MLARSKMTDDRTSVSKRSRHEPFLVAIDETRGGGTGVGARADEEDDAEEEGGEVEDGRLVGKGQGKKEGG